MPLPSTLPACGSDVRGGGAGADPPIGGHAGSPCGMSLSRWGRRTAGAARETVMSESIRARGPWKLAFERIGRDRWAIAAAACIGFIILAALFAPWIAAAVAHSPEAQFRETGLS